VVVSSADCGAFTGKFGTNRETRTLYCRNISAAVKYSKRTSFCYVCAHGRPYYIHVFNYCNLFGRARRLRRRRCRIYPKGNEPPKHRVPRHRTTTTKTDEGRGGSRTHKSLPAVGSGNVVLMCRYQINPKVVVGVVIHLTYTHVYITRLPRRRWAARGCGGPKFRIKIPLAGHVRARTPSKSLGHARAVREKWRGRNH